MKSIYNISRVLAVAAGLSLLTACGGGGGDSDNSSNNNSLNINDILLVPADDNTVTVVLADGTSITIDEDLLPDDLIDGEGNVDLDQLPDGLVDADGNIDEEILDDLLGDLLDVGGPIDQLVVLAQDEPVVPSVGSNPEPVTGLLSLIALTAGGLAATRRARKA